MPAATPSILDSSSTPSTSTNMASSNPNSSENARPPSLKGPIHNKLLDSVIRTPNRTPSPQPTHLGIPGQPHKVLQESGTGYVAPKFEGRLAQMEKVMDMLEVKNFLPAEFVENETKWFYDELGIDDMYFQTETIEAIANHILSLYAAKVAAYARDDKTVMIRLDKEAKDHAVYFDTSKPGISVVHGPQYEQRIDEKYLNISNKNKAYRVETFRSHSLIPGSDHNMLRCYFVYQCHFNEGVGETETNIEMVGDQRFLQKATTNTKEIYQEILQSAVGRTGPVIEYFDVEGSPSQEKRLVIAYKQGSALGLFSALSDLYHYYGLTSSRKYVEQFANGYTIISVYLKPAPGDTYLSKHVTIESSIHQIVKELSLLYCLPQNKFQQLFATGRLSLQETIYAHSVWVFTCHFVNRLGSEYNTLVSLLDQNNTVQAELLAKLKRRLRSETFTSDYLVEIITRYPQLIHTLYVSFANTHYVQMRGPQDDFIPTLSFQRLKIEDMPSEQEIQKRIEADTINEHDLLVMGSFLTFNHHVLKTNFYTPTKVALSFRLNPQFLPKSEYPQPLHGMFLVIGSEFRGFHLRFRDIARGGIRIVKSRNREAYVTNVKAVFDENYNLANTQQRKNKDIPEGGSKGVILLDPKHQSKATVAFEKYIDSILDLLLPPQSPGIKDPIVDLYGKEEILFMGPDENTAELVDWATEHARIRGATFWKSFFTGKSPRLGGIPHDRFGMTTLSVREFVTGIYRKLNLDPSKVSKMQTGGPDGDLGSNEILLANERYTAIVDGSGVLYDSRGLDRDELVRLAKNRKMINNFDITRLSSEGYRVLVEDVDVKLPSGEVVHNGTTFRNTFHLRPGHYDSFVPCGGRPESIDISSANKLIFEGKSTIPYIVEGANLFITQDAKLKLEKAGTILYKDASANKGGVTSSSLEVLASLSFDDASFLENMCIHADGTTPPFYDAYVKEIQEIICRNARLEFEAIWREHSETGIARSILSDQLSVAITDMDEQLQASELWEDESFRSNVLKDALPKLLLEKIGLDTLLKRVPDNYLRAIFGSYLASRFIYQYGTQAGPFAFMSFVNKRMKQANATTARTTNTTK